MNQLDRYTCEQVFQRLDDYIDRELAPDEMRMIQEHMEECAWCANTFKFEVGVLETVKKRLQRFQAPQSLMSKITAALDAAERKT